MDTVKEKITYVELSEIVPSPYQGRLLSSKDKENDPKTNEALKELCDSISKNGFMQPPVVRKVGDRYELVDGHRRCIAAGWLGISKIPVIVREYDNKQAQTCSIIGNMERVNLTPLETARAYSKAVNSGLFKNNRELADALGKTDAYIGQVINVLQLDQRVINDVDEKGTISDIRILTAIRSFDKVDGKRSDKQWGFYQKIVKEGLSRESVVRYLNASKPSKSSEPARLVSFSEKGKATLKFDAAELPSEKRPELEAAFKGVIDSFLAKSESATPEPAAA